MNFKNFLKMMNLKNSGTVELTLTRLMVTKENLKTLSESQSQTLSPRTKKKFLELFKVIVSGGSRKTGEGILWRKKI